MHIATPEKTETARQAKHFLPYQIRWLLDESRFKLWEKSRRIGATRTQGYEDVKGSVKGTKWPVLFSSADESAGLEYIRYAELWAQVFDVAAKYLGEVIIDGPDGIKAFTIEFAKGYAPIHALSSNPKAFRSKGGRVRLDEFAFHSDAARLWAAARPCITWGGDMRILSTHNGKGCLYYRTLEDAKTKIAQGLPTPWSVHTTDIFLAVREGLADRIVGRELTDDERAAWTEEQRASCLDEETWQQEFCCQPIDEATAYLTYDLIRTIEDDAAGLPANYAGGPCYVGNDIGRRRDLWVLDVKEKVGDVFWTRERVILKGATFAAHDAELARIMHAYKVVRLCMDQTGMGEKPVEDAKRRYGDYRVEGVVFTGEVKQELAQTFKRAIEDRQLREPKDPALR
ncbi:MAG: terminase family protein, partial [Elusimicrobiota bacterium]